MVPVFDKAKRLVGWFDDGHLYSAQLEWVAFRDGGHLFSSTSCKWLGQIESGSLRDREGKVVAWIEGARPSSGLRPLQPLTPFRPLQPLRPLKPLNPLTPLVPLTPLGGWSSLSWEQWLQ